MTNIACKTKHYKIGVIRDFWPFFMAGKVTAREVESIACKETLYALERGRIK